jgi:aspartate/glutamate racemase
VKTIGLIGGMSWESSAEYYRLINQETKRRLGGHHNARSLMVTVDFAEVEYLQHAGDWEALGRMLADADGNWNAAARTAWCFARTRCIRWRIASRQRWGSQWCISWTR